MPDVAVAAIEIGFRLRYRHVVRPGVGQRIFAGLDLPLAPGRNDLQLRRDGFVCKLKPYLVVALPGAAVSKGVRAGPQSNLRLALGQNRTGKGRAQQIFVFVNGSCSQGRPDIPGDEFLTQILNGSRRSAGGERLAPCGF